MKRRTEEIDGRARLTRLAPLMGPTRDGETLVGLLLESGRCRRCCPGVSCSACVAVAASTLSGATTLSRPARCPSVNRHPRTLPPLATGLDNHLVRGRHCSICAAEETEGSTVQPLSVWVLFVLSLFGEVALGRTLIGRFPSSVLLPLLATYVDTSETPAATGVCPGAPPFRAKEVGEEGP